MRKYFHMWSTVCFRFQNEQDKDKTQTSCIFIFQVLRHVFPNSQTV